VPRSSLTIEQALTLLPEAPPRRAALTDGLTAAQLQARPTPEEWSAIQVLAHLRSCADLWGDCIRLMLTENHPTVRAINPQTWITQTNYSELEFQPSLEAFTTQRAALLAILAPLPSEDWARAATVTGVGKPLERTVFDFAQRLARHERPHLKQIARIVSTMHLA
jgi:hypothetical protein